VDLTGDLLTDMAGHQCTSHQPASVKIRMRFVSG
jgi:hypothetical protein